MTPKEEAKRIWEQYYDEIIGRNLTSGYFENGLNGIAKQCALIAVDELIVENHKCDSFEPRSTALLIDRLLFWQEVKEELENL